MNRFFYTFFFITAFISTVSAQKDTCQYSFSGHITDGETGKGFPFAAVFIKEVQKGGASDSNGHFRIKNICVSRITVTYSALGYKSFTAVYNLKQHQTDLIILHTDTCELESVTVSGKKTEENASLTYSTLEGRALERTRGLVLGEVLKEIPGVNTLRTGNSVSKPVLHGLHSNRVLILNAGLRQEGQQWGNEHGPEIDPYVSDRITVVKGASGVRYGSDAIAGVIIIEPRLLPEETGAGAEINMAGMSNGRQGVVSALAEGKLGNKLPLKWRGQGTLKKGGNIHSPRYYQANTGSEEMNFSYSAGYEKKWFSGEIFYSQFNTKIGIFAGAHTGSVNDLKKAIQAEEPALKADFSYQIGRPWQYVEHELARIKLSAAFNPAVKLHLLLGRQFNDRKEFDVRSFTVNALKENPQLEFKLTTHSSDLVFEHHLKHHIKGSAGVSYLQQGNIWQGRKLIPNFKSRSYGIFLLEQWARNKTLLEAGIRIDLKELDVFENQNNIINQTSYRFSNISSSVGGTYNVTSQTLLRFNLGTGWRAPNVNELFSEGLHHGAAAIESGNKGLKQEQSLKAIASVETKSTKTNWEAAIYINRIRNFIYLRPDLVFVQTIRGAFPSFSYHQTEALFYGGDLFFDHAFHKNLRAGAKGSFVLADNLSEKIPVFNIPPVTYRPFVQYQLRNTPAVSAYARLTLTRTEHQNRAPDNSDYMDPPPSYTLYDLELGTDLNWNKQKVSLLFQVNNMFNHAYRDYMNRFRYFTDEMGRNFVLKIKIPLSIYHKQ